MLSAIVALFIIQVMAQQTADLRMNLEKNKLYRLKSVSEQTIIQTISGNQQTVESKVQYSISVKMLDVTSEFMVAEVHFDTLITNTNTMGKTTSINSTVEGDIKSSETGDIMSSIMNKLSRNAIYVKIDLPVSLLK
jgi:proteasome assembly chaperone (PAC2) family protein